MATFHQTNFGRWQNTFDSDLDGFVATTPAEVKALRWPEDVTDAQALAIAESNTEQLDKAERELRTFRDFDRW